MITCYSPYLLRHVLKLPILQVEKQKSREFKRFLYSHTIDCQDLSPAWPDFKTNILSTVVSHLSLQWASVLQYASERTCWRDACLSDLPWTFIEHIAQAHEEKMERKWGWEKPLSLLDLFALFLTRVRYSPSARLPSFFHIRFVLNDFRLFPKKSQTKIYHHEGYSKETL